MQKKKIIKNKRKWKQTCRNKKIKENYALLIQTNIHYKFIILLNVFFQTSIISEKVFTVQLLHASKVHNNPS